MINRKERLWSCSQTPQSHKADILIKCSFWPKNTKSYSLMWRGMRWKSCLRTERSNSPSNRQVRLNSLTINCFSFWGGGFKAFIKNIAKWHRHPITWVTPYIGIYPEYNQLATRWVALIGTDWLRLIATCWQSVHVCKLASSYLQTSPICHQQSVKSQPDCLEPICLLLCVNKEVQSFYFLSPWPHLVRMQRKLLSISCRISWFTSL